MNYVYGVRTFQTAIQVVIATDGSTDGPYYGQKWRRKVEQERLYAAQNEMFWRIFNFVMSVVTALVLIVCFSL